MRTIDHFMSFAVSLLPVVQFEHVKTLFESTQSQESKSEIDLHRSMRQCALWPILWPNLYFCCFGSNLDNSFPLTSLPLLTRPCHYCNFEYLYCKYVDNEFIFIYFLYNLLVTMSFPVLSWHLTWCHRVRYCHTGCYKCTSKTCQTILDLQDAPKLFPSLRPWYREECGESTEPLPHCQRVMEIS